MANDLATRRRARLAHNGHRASMDRSPGHSEEGGLSRCRFEFDADVDTEAFDQAYRA
jgi:hypothetical protein